MQSGLSEAEMQLEKLLGPMHAKSAMAELSRSQRDDGARVYSKLFSLFCPVSQVDVAVLRGSFGREIRCNKVDMNQSWVNM
jgi:hypothetical protein